jgi:hypothetical protein
MLNKDQTVLYFHHNSQDASEVERIFFYRHQKEIVTGVQVIEYAQ